MAVVDLSWPSRLLAGGGPGLPDARVLRALGSPLIGQFDPAFTAIMDDVMALARQAFLTTNERCFPVSGLAAAGLEALLNSLVEEGDRVAIGGTPKFVAETADCARRLGAHVQAGDELAEDTSLLVVPLVDPTSGKISLIRSLAAHCHAQGVLLVVEATFALAACELRVDDWHVDAVTAGADYALGAPSGMALVTYTPEVEARMQNRRSPPKTSYLDLLQLQAYWSPERLNHHTAPTALVYGLRKALRLLQEEGLTASWERHHRVGTLLRDGLKRLGLEPQGDPPYAVVHVPDHLDEAQLRRALLEDFGIHIQRIAAHTWRLGLLGADARTEAVNRLLTALEHLLGRNL